jgi:glucosylceramidase
MIRMFHAIGRPRLSAAGVVCLSLTNRAAQTTTLAVMVLSACIFVPTRALANQRGFLTSAGTRFVDQSGEEIILKGCNLGSWLTLEMWMLDVKDDKRFPDQYTVERVLQERFGKPEKNRIMDLHREHWITERDFEMIRSLGFNCIRVPFHYSIIEDDDNPLQVREGAWRWFDKIIDLAQRYDLYVILDLHGAPGCQNKFDHSGRRDWNRLWDDRTYWQRTAWLWEQIAARYQDCATIAAFQPINEPWGGSTEAQTELFDFLYKAIRKHDQRHVVIASAHFTGFDHFGDPQDHGWNHVGYSQNFYPGLFGGGATTPATHRDYLAWLDNALKPKLDALNIPFLITEFNVVFDAAGGAPMMRRHYDAYAKHGWAATMWSYKLITSPGRKNTGGWWLITDTGEARTGAWWIVTNQTPLPPVDFQTADKSEIEAWFRSFATVDYQVNEGLKRALLAKASPPPVPPTVTPTMTAPPARDTIEGWTAVDINSPPAGGQKLIADDTVEVYAAGRDIWGREDQFRFVQQKSADDFSLSVSLDALTFTHTYAKAGLMVRQSLDKEAAFVAVNALPDGSIEFGIRPATGQEVTSTIMLGAKMPGLRMRLVRTGNRIERSFACGAGEWEKFDSVSLGRPGEELCVGFFCMSHDNENFTTARFSDLAFETRENTWKIAERPNIELPNGQRLLGNNAYPAMSYSGDRTVARTVENSPSVAEIKEDLKILSAMGVKLIRTYNTAEFPQSARILQVIRELRQADPEFEMYVMLGAWINCQGAFTPDVDHSREDAVWNKTEIDKAIELAQAYPDVAKIIAVGNEAMVHWQAHFVHPAVILKWVNYLRQARAEGRLPPDTLITTSENWAALGGEAAYRNADLLELLRQIDFLSLHTYAFHDTHYNQGLLWGATPDELDLPVAEQAQRSIERAVASQQRQFAIVEQFLKDNGINKAIHLGETGWATLDDALYSDEGTCAGDEYLSKLFYDAVQDWTRARNLTCFYFEAFDEPWKSDGTAGSEGHFGLFTVDGKAKFPLWDLVDRGVFKGLTRGGQPIVKTHGGDAQVLLRKLKVPRAKAGRKLEVHVTARDTGERLTARPALPLRKGVTGAAKTVITLDPQQTFQSIEGFGGAFTEAAAYTLSRIRPELRSQVLRAYFDPKVGIGYTMCRTHINSCDFSLGNYAYNETPGDYALKQFDISRDKRWLIPMIKDAQAVPGARFRMLASPWSPPAWMKTTGRMNLGGKLKPECRDAWALYFAKYIEAYAAEGINIWGVTIQNEPAATQTWDSCIYTAEEERDFVRDHLGPTLAKRGHGDVKILIWDHNKEILYERAAPTFLDPQAAKYVWGVGFHWYTGDHFDQLEKVHKAFPQAKLLFTEGCQEGGLHLTDWAVGERYGHDIIGDLNHWAVGWIDWNMVLDERGGPNHVNNLCDAPIIADTVRNKLYFENSYYYLGHFSKFIRPGAVRIGCVVNNPDLETTAFRNPDGRIAVVTMNRTDDPIDYRLQIGDEAVESGSPAHSITTLRFAGE